MMELPQSTYVPKAQLTTHHDCGLLLPAMANNPPPKPQAPLPMKKGAGHNVPKPPPPKQSKSGGK
jgi:hypothetical protein